MTSPITPAAIKPLNLNNLMAQADQKPVGTPVGGVTLSGSNKVAIVTGP